MQAKNQVVLLGRSCCFFKLEQTVESNYSANRVRKKGPPSYFAVAALTSNFIPYFYNALDVFSTKMKSLCSIINIFLKSAKTEVKFVRPTKLEKRLILYLIQAA